MEASGRWMAMIVYIKPTSKNKRLAVFEIFNVLLLSCKVATTPPSWLIMEEGRIIHDGPPLDIISKESALQTLRIPPVLQLLKTLQINLDSLSHTTIEEKFAEYLHAYVEGLNFNARDIPPHNPQIDHSEGETSTTSCLEVEQ